ncbi:phage tail sheath C-terminal domain-containing protein [Piscinibacter sakaiensis]|uniref:phage tail sheath C-terminal domain-containing protein n=1 Tax=Piscinibacter sakaiensis TaxID=1547922 RepID=UPI003AAA339F
MFGLSFESAAAVEAAHPARADIALFVGWTTRRASAKLPRPVAEWLHARRHLAQDAFATDAWQDDALLNLPLPIDSWAVFETLFDWHARPVGGSAGERCDDYLGLALRAFFANGGRKAYVLRLGDPWPVTPQVSGSEREARLAQLLPPAGSSSWQRESWRGIETAWALDDVSLVLVPDLPELFGDQRTIIEGDEAQSPPVPEVFVECADTLLGADAVGGVQRIRAPRSGDVGYGEWNATVRALRDRLAQRRRDLMLLLATPLPAVDSSAARRLADTVTLRSSMVQLATPWLRPTHAARTPEGLLPADGVLAGLVAAGVLSRGAARTVAGAAPTGVSAVFPQPADEELRTPNPQREARALVSRFSLFAPTHDGVRLLSDLSCSAIDAWRHAGVVRLLGQLLRTARQVGETLVFEPSGEALWTRVRSRFEDMLTRYWQAGALRGASAAEAFSVRCDRSVMSQNDLDNGRVIVLVSFTPQLSIERLRVTLALAEDGSVSLADAAELDEVTP